MQEKIEKLLAEMTLEEKVSMIAGADFWHTVAIERLGIPAIKVTDGPNGARGAGARGEVPSACFPVGVALGATWNTELIGKIGESLADEVKAKDAHILLAPTVNIHRSPSAGRNFECYSEDPYLTAQAACAYINGLQNNGVGACLKHFIANDSEFERHSISSEIDERTLREIYLYPFMVAMEKAKPWSVMASYNKINGVYAAENAYTQMEILKGEWEFDGIIMSDWFGTQSTVDSANNGLDLEMPGPAKWMGDKLLQAVKDGEVDETKIDDRVRRLLLTIIKVGAMESPQLAVETTADTPEQRALIRAAASEAIVLLKNENSALPLASGKIKKLAIIGPNAKVARVMGGGSSHVRPYYEVTPFEGITNRAGDELQIEYAVGCSNHKQLPLISMNLLSTESAKGLFTVNYFNNQDLSGEPVYTETHHSSDIMWTQVTPGPVDDNRFSARLSGTLTPDENGVYTFGLTSSGLGRLYIDDNLLIDHWASTGKEATHYDSGAHRDDTEATIEMSARKSYQIKIEYCKHQDITWAGARIGCLPPIPEDAVERAAKLAADSDVAVIFAGLSDEWESEGFDMPDMNFPENQTTLIEKVAAANPNTIVVLNIGSPIAMPWLDKVAAVAVAWFPGQEGGNAIADVLFGDVSPSGKLPTTFPKRLEDNPAYINYPGENGKVFYGEGIFVGYRYYDKKKVEPLFPFGHGLSYTTFEYGNLSLNGAEYAPGDEIQVKLKVTNNGKCAAKEIVQLYVRDVKTAVARPEKELKAYKKIALESGESKTVEFVLNHDALAYYDTLQKGWFAPQGEFEIIVGSSSRDIRQKASFVLNASVLSRSANEVVKLNSRNSLRELLANEQSRSVLERLFPDMLNNPRIEMGMNLTLRQIADHLPDLLTEDALNKVDEELGKV
jgi:beta-glucosidase